MQTQSRWFRPLPSLVSIAAVLAIGCGGGGQAPTGDPAGAAKQGVITGKVFGKSGQALGGAMLSFNGKTPGTSGGGSASNRDGTFSWGGPRGTYEVAVMIAGKTLYTQTVQLDKERVEGVELRPK